VSCVQIPIILERRDRARSSARAPAKEGSFHRDKNRSLSVLANREARPLRLLLGWVIFMGAVLIGAKLQVATRSYEELGMSIGDPRGRTHHETEWQVTTLRKAKQWVPDVTEDQLPITINQITGTGRRLYVRIYDKSMRLILTRG
jgi:hypothetical protein